VAHISATSFVAARVVHDIHDRRTAAFEYLNSTHRHEPAALAELVARRDIKTDSEIGLMLVDGGKTQLNAAVEALGKTPRTFRVVSAVKPPGRHSEISHFLTEDGGRIEFDVTSGTHRLLLAIRDEVHELANSVHRLTRDMAGFYELAGVLPSIDEAGRQKLIADVGSIRRITELPDEKIRKMFDGELARLLIRDLKNYRNGNSVDVLPLIVPIRYDEFAGGAEDLRPILTRGGK
jgi:excinuclease ABC subunit C